MMPARADMFVDESEDPRHESPMVGTETELLTGFLRWQRETLELKCADLSPMQLAERAVPPSTMSLLGLVRHMADVERGWFRRRMAGLDDAPPIYYSEDNPDGDFDDVIGDQATVDDAWARWRAEVAFGDEFVSNAADLDVIALGPTRSTLSLRWVIIHLIEEYARHLGHADLLREKIDGKLGQ